MTKNQSNVLIDLSRMMIKQARMLRDAGLVADAKALAQRAIMLDSCGWAARSLEPVRVPVRRPR